VLFVSLPTFPFPPQTPTLSCMPFRVLIAGPKRFTDYPTLRAALDKSLVNRLLTWNCSPVAVPVSPCSRHPTQPSAG
jgi:hypothetical protein